MPLALFALTIGAFAIGTTEFVIVGLVPTIAQQLSISLPSAGLLVSIYALGVAIGAPVLTALTGRMPRKQLLLALMVLFTAGNLLAWQAPGYATLVFARLLTGLAHGVFFSIGSTIATSLVPKEKAASAIAIMFGGLTVALVTGVPIGTFIGQHFGWHATFLAVSLFGLIAWLGALAFVPRTIAHVPPAPWQEQARVLLTQPVRQARTDKAAAKDLRGNAQRRIVRVALPDRNAQRGAEHRILFFRRLDDPFHRLDRAIRLREPLPGLGGIPVTEQLAEQRLDRLEIDKHAEAVELAAAHHGLHDPVVAVQTTALSGVLANTMRGFKIEAYR